MNHKYHNAVCMLYSASKYAITNIDYMLKSSELPDEVIKMCVNLKTELRNYESSINPFIGSPTYDIAKKSLDDLDHIISDFFMKTDTYRIDLTFKEQLQSIMAKVKNFLMGYGFELNKNSFFSHRENVIDMQDRLNDQIGGTMFNSSNQIKEGRNTESMEF